MERSQVCSLLRPSESREGPKLRGKPGIKDVRILLPAIVLGCFHTAIDLIATVPDRDTVPEPDLTAHAPVPQVIDPMKVCVTKSFLGHGHTTMLNGCTHKFFEGESRATRYSGYVRLFKHE